jgi:hypothetical protein
MEAVYIVLLYEPCLAEYILILESGVFVVVVGVTNSITDREVPFK